jgi:hypothetical protein
MQPEIMIAAKPGIVYLEGQRRMVRKGRTTAHSTHPIVTEHPRLWERLKVDYPAAPDAAYAEAVAAAGVPAFEALRVLAQGLADRGHDVQVAGGDEASVPMAVVLAALAVIDESGAELERRRANGQAYLLAHDHLAAVASTLVDRVLEGAPVDEQDAAAEKVRAVLTNDLEDYLTGAIHKPADEPPAEAASEAAETPADVDGPDVDSAEFRAAVRAWAATQEIEVSPRGKVPAAVVERYRAAHSAG